MLGLPSGTRIWWVAGATDMRKGFDGLSALVQTALNDDPFSGQLFVFRGCRGDRVRFLWWDGQGLCLYYTRIETGKFIWLRVEQGRVHLTPAQLSMLLEGIDWRCPFKPKTPSKAA
jgi:transposase